MFTAIVVRAKHAQTTHQHGHFRCGQSQLLRFIDQQRFCRCRAWFAAIVTEPIGERLEQFKHLNIRLILTRVHTTWSKRHMNADTCSAGGFFNPHDTSKNDDIGQRRFSGITLDFLQNRQRTRSNRIDIPAALRR